MGLGQLHVPRNRLARALSHKGTVGAFSVARPSLANSLRSDRASERRPAPTKAPTPARAVFT